MHRDAEVIRCDELHLAAEAGDVERVRELIAQGHDVNAFDELDMRRCITRRAANILTLQHCSFNRART